ncbi:MAG: HU family DNA-binding protein [Bacteroidales bacterium]|nr:HU family DNA-binding protein [Bacteroidales bacterium]
MNKAELIAAMSNEAELTKAEAKKALDAFIKITSKALIKGDRIALVGFGSWSIKVREARKGRNPQTKKEMDIPEKKVVKFKASTELANAVN